MHVAADERIKAPNKACTGRLGLGAFFRLVSDLWQFSVSQIVSPQPPITQTVGQFLVKRNTTDYTQEDVMNKYEQFIQQEIQSVLAPNKSPQALGFLFNKSLLGMVMFGILSFAGEGYFFAVATQRQLLLIATEMGFSALKTTNKGITQIPYDQIEAIKVGGFLNQKTITLKLKTGEAKRFRLNVLATFVPGQKQFIKKLQSLYQLSAKAV